MTTISDISTPSGLLDTKQMARHLGINAKLLKHLASRRKIPVVRLGHRTLRFNVRAVEAAIAKLTQEAV